MKKLIHCLLILVIFAGMGGITLADIEYKETLTQVLHERDVGGTAGSKVFSDVTASADGSVVALKVLGSNPTSYGLYLMNGDGTELRDIGTQLCEEVDWWSLHSLRLNHDGSLLFFSFNNNNGTNFYYYDIAYDVCVPAMQEVHGAQSFGPYVINREGTGIWFHHDAGSDPATRLPRRGIFFASLPRGIINPQKVMVVNVEDLPCATNCRFWFNLLDLLDVSGNGSELLFRWDRNSSTGGSQGMWTTTSGGTPILKPTEEHEFIWVSGQRHRQNRLIGDEGEVALYKYRDKNSTTRLCTLDFSNPGPDPVLIAESNSFFHESLSPDGSYARFSDDASHFKDTRLNLRTGEARDTLSYHIYRTAKLTNLTSDNRYYFMHRWKAHIDTIHRVDMNPTDFSVAPNVNNIGFSSSSLVHDGTSRVSVYVRISDAQGLENIEWVKMRTLVEGLEDPNWKLKNPEWNNTSPLYYDAVLYDNGSYGDKLAGDGVYSNDSLKTRADSGFYQYYSLPHDVGIRVVAKDVDDNYVIADTTLTIVPR